MNPWMNGLVNAVSSEPLDFPKPAFYVCLLCGGAVEDPGQHDFQLCWWRHRQKEGNDDN